MSVQTVRAVGTAGLWVMRPGVEPRERNAEPFDPTAEPCAGNAAAREGNVRAGEGAGGVRRGTAAAGEGAAVSRDGNVRAGEGAVEARQGKAPARGGIAEARGGDVEVRAGNVRAGEGAVEARHGIVEAPDGNVRAGESAAEAPQQNASAFGTGVEPGARNVSPGEDEREGRRDATACARQAVSSPSRRANLVEVFPLPTDTLTARNAVFAARAEALGARAELFAAGGVPAAVRPGPAVSPARIGVIVSRARPDAGQDTPRWRTALRAGLTLLNSRVVRTHFGTVAGVVILAVLLWRMGTGVFLDGLRRIDTPTLLAALLVGLLTTVFSAWRWALVARGLGIRLPLVPALADYYRALFLNAALPGGVLGDVHRAVRHGKSSGDLGRGVRAVVLERAAGQAVLAVVGAAVLLTMPSPVLADARHLAPLLGLAALGALAVVLALRMNRTEPSRRGRALRAGLAEAREGLLSRRNGPGVAVSSAVVLAGHIGMFVLAARVAGSAASVAALLPLAVLALLAMGLPLNIGGFGPREGVTAWAFGAAGLGASSGLAVAVVYGVLSFVAALPGALVLVARWYTGLRGTDDGAGNAVTDPAAGTVVADPAPHRAPDGDYPRSAPAVLVVPSGDVSIEKYVPKESAKPASSSFPFSADPREGRPMTPESV